MKRIASLFATVLVAGSLVPAFGITPSAGAASANGRILFTHCDETIGCQIYTANPDGSAIRQVTSQGDNFAGDWSPDGTRIAYAGYASGDAAIWIADADGSNAKQLTPDDPDSDSLWPRFTPDGGRILFVNCLGVDCDGGIGSVRTDGTHRHLVTPNSHDSYNLADPSPGGARMAYMRWHVGGVKMAIYVSDAEGMHQRRLSPARLQGWWPDWSPTGERILFTSEVFYDRPSPALYSVRPSGNGLQQLTHPPFPHADAEGSYSPDGTKIVFQSDRRYDDFCCSDLFTIDALGGNLHRIRLPLDAFDPRWGTTALLPSGSGANTRITESLGGSPCANVPELSGTAMCASGA
jgi:Tol biopolymer transport system component